MYFLDRKDAGKKLAELVKPMINGSAVVYALPRGGVVIGREIAKTLGAPLDLIITRKIGHPYSPEYAIGAVAENGHTVFEKFYAADVDPGYLKREIETQKKEAGRRSSVYLGSKVNSPSSEGKTAIITDDGIATGLTMKAAVTELKLHRKPEKILVAVPVMPADLEEEFVKYGAEVLSIIKDKNFLGSVGSYYKDFSQVSDSEVIRIINL